MSSRPDIGVTLGQAVERHVVGGDVVHVMLGHSRWTAAARELVRQQWRAQPGLTLVMTSLGALGALFFEGGLVERVVTTYSGNSFPTYTPNPVFQTAYQSGAVAVEHWSILTLAQRLEAAARGLPAAVTGSLAGSAMAANEGFETADTPFGQVGLVAPLAPDVTLLHAAASDRQGNLALSAPLLEGVWGAWAARRGVVATVERIVDDLTGCGDRGGFGGSGAFGAFGAFGGGGSGGSGAFGGGGQMVRIPAHRVLAVVEAPFGAHPGGCFAPGIPVKGYGEDIACWSEAAAAAARNELGDWARRWALEPADHQAYLRLVGDDRLSWLAGRTDPSSWHSDSEEHPLPDGARVSLWEVAACFAAREVETVVAALGADAVLAGAGVANLSAWVAVARARAGGSSVHLTAELGLFGYSPTPADPYIFNHRCFPGTPFLSDASTVLGMVIGGPGTVSVGCLGAAEVDRDGNLNSTQLADGRFLVGSGGANDVVSRADACVVVTRARPERLPAEVAYVTCSGGRVASVVTDHGILRRLDGELRVAAVPAAVDGVGVVREEGVQGPDGTGRGSLEDRVRAFRERCGWEPEVASSVEELAPVTMAEVLALRDFDRERVFLR